MKRIILIFITASLVSCSGYKSLTKKVTTQFDNSFFENQFSGLFVYDPISGDTIINYNGDKYFTPASNTKIFTLYAAMSLLPDFLPSIQYTTSDGKMYIRGVGNPAALHPVLQDSSLIEFLKKQQDIHLYYDNLEDTQLGPGWAWDDFDAYYSPERSSLPLFGNIVRLSNRDSLYVSIDSFKNHVKLQRASYRRAIGKNEFYLSTSQKDTIEVPFITDSTVIRKILEHQTGKSITIVDHFPTTEIKTIYGIAADSVYKQLMQVSDNFIAEQLLIMASTTLGDNLSSAKTRQYILENQLNGLAHKPRWVDGSGLSRYNLFTPSSMVYTLKELYEMTPKETLYNIFPTGGESGTLERYFKGDPRPYIHAKTGSLSNNYCLSGYLVADSGKTLIFSFMNNHYRRSSNDLKAKMAQILEFIRDNY
ncbi:peptidase S13 D-Ala-D-Ala carboxypeptidase C [Galbibacter marinus]|uniref:Peptidase S13 D-Ala-D-Ala carboxypeptidase C n=1 Tax=Galbibacter marinus TaxID=555500 RepID=K2QMW4_9FLAO|nr:D-alanyl-D-alanine carboxypeptidase [Galbibacter marinus]EKF56177.1 peptidase S13 D-Ala-D-Ala carboxypeptidase C [Galbibacter marinus]